MIVFVISRAKYKNLITERALNREYIVIKSTISRAGPFMNYFDTYVLTNVRNYSSL